MEHKKYSIEYCSGATGYSWQEEYDRLEEFEDFIKEMRKNYTARITIFDHKLKKFIFYKRALSFKPETDMLCDLFRDMRTKTRKVK